MASVYDSRAIVLRPTSRGSIFIPIVILFSIAMVAGILFLFFGDGFSNPFTELYLLPWIGLAAAVILTPSVYLAMRGTLDLFHPLVFATWSYFFPAFILGSLILASGISQPFYLTFIPDLEYYLPLTLVYVALGFAGLTFGFFLPIGKKLGTLISPRLPRWDWAPKDLLLPGVILLAIGLFFSTTAFTAGIIGYQRSEIIETLDATLASFTLFVLISSFMLWYSIFRAEKRTLPYLLVIGVLVALIPYSAVLSGSRGGLIQNLMPIAMAFWLSGRRISMRHGIIFGMVLSVAVLVGVIYGTTFRGVKGSEEQVDFDSYLTSSSKAIELIANRGVSENLSFGLETLAARMETTSSLAVVVANYEKLETYASDYGLAGNIWTFTWTAFIPRFIWPDKPIISDARAYSALYFDYGDNSFAMTPMGDLLRNFGPLGVPIGMALLGMVLRILHVALVESQMRSVWLSATYFMLLTRVSYEGFYGTILPDMIRTSVILLISGILINFMIRRKSTRI